MTNPDFVRHSHPERPRPDLGDSPGDRTTGEGWAVVSAVLAVLVGAVPFVFVFLVFLVTVSHGAVGWAVFFGATLASPIALSIALGRVGQRSGKGGAARGLWIGVLVLVVVTVPAAGVDVSIGLAGLPW